MKSNFWDEKSNKRNFPIKIVARGRDPNSDILAKKERNRGFTKRARIVLELKDKLQLHFL